MKTAILNPQGFELRDVETPSFSENEVLVKTTACGVCSGDVFVYQTRSDNDIHDLVLGHEATGVIVAAGQNIQDFAEGDLVTALGGAYADYFAISPEQLAKVPDSIDPLHALGEPIACCVHAGNRFGIQPGDRVAVAGCGFMGLICMQLAKYQGAGHICAIDPMAYRREMSLQLGADEALHPDEVQVKDRWEGEFEVVIEAAGVQSVVDICSDLVKQHGRLILIGYHQSKGGMRSVDMKLWNYKAIDVVNGHIRRETEKLEAMRQGMTLMHEGHLITEPLVTLYNLEDVTQAFHDLTSGKEGLFKAVITTDSGG